MEQKKDTIFSVQSIWGKLIENDFESQYGKLDKIKNKLGINLYNAFSDFMHYYHTIGNIMPCPGRLPEGGQTYNQKKGHAPFDRMDYFIESEKGRDFLESEGCFGFYEGSRVLFLDSNFKEKYAIKSNILGKEYNLLNPPILSATELHSIIMGIKKNKNDCENKKKLCNYLKSVIEIIKRRTEVLVDNFISYAIRDYSEEGRCPQN